MVPGYKKEGLCGTLTRPLSSVQYKRHVADKYGIREGLQVVLGWQWVFSIGSLRSTVSVVVDAVYISRPKNAYIMCGYMPQYRVTCRGMSKMVDASWC